MALLAAKAVLLILLLALLVAPVAPAHVAAAGARPRVVLGKLIVDADVE